ncbi:MAG: ATP-grasp fold amidoligase family protein [Marinosulfonomonas sp.]
MERPGLQADKRFVREQYYAFNKRYPDLDAPRDLSEKICRRKISDQPDLIVQCTDKLAVRDHVTAMAGPDVVVPLYFSTTRLDDITPENIPQRQFALKTNHDQAGVLLCADSQKFDWQAARQKMSGHLTRNYYDPYREMQYRDIQPTIFAEALLTPDGDQDVIPDYKFFCFHGKPELIQVDMSRFSDHVRAFVSPDWSPMDVQYDDPVGVAPAARPDCLDQMLELAKKLSAPFSFVRVDLYQSGGKVYFGELTFTPGAGTKRFLPDSFERHLGDLWSIDFEQSIL